MTTKLECILSSVGAGVFSFISWLSTVPPEQQSGWLAALVEITPVEYRPNVALFTRFAGLFLGIYATYKAAHSAPSTPLTKQ